MWVELAGSCSEQFSLRSFECQLTHMDGQKAVGQTEPAKGKY